MFVCLCVCVDLTSLYLVHIQLMDLVWERGPILSHQRSESKSKKFLLPFVFSWKEAHHKVMHHYQHIMSSCDGVCLDEVVFWACDSHCAAMLTHWSSAGTRSGDGTLWNDQWEWAAWPSRSNEGRCCDTGRTSGTQRCLAHRYPNWCSPGKFFFK